MPAYTSLPDAGDSNNNLETLSVDGYTLTSDVTEDYITTITNTHTPEKMDIPVIKVWSDDNNESGKRPLEISVTLYANGEEVETVSISEEDEWKHIFTDLDVYNNGEEIEYTISENDVPSGYEVAYEGDMHEGFTIHNILGQGGDVPPTNPQTGDNILIYLVTLFISIFGLIISKKYLKNENC